MFMAHKYNAGHPNFDADRYISVAAIAMLYPDHPHAKQWLDHAARSLRKAMRVYVISQSGKWAENLGGYYNWSTNIIGGMAWALKFTGSADPYAWPEFQNFWRWGLVTMLPPKPSTGQLGKVAADELKRIRLTAGIGDNGGDGGLGVHGGFALAGAGILKHNPELGRQLLWFWNEGGRSGYRHYPYSLYFGLSPEQIKIAADSRSRPDLRSQVLEGYGSLFRADFGQPTESYVLFKSGPGGYRYHGEEGSFVLFGLGQPIALDGGRAWRAHEHGTVTFGEKMLGLYRGRIVHFESTPSIDYACGKFPGSTEQMASLPDRPQAESSSGKGRRSFFGRLFEHSQDGTPTPDIHGLLSTGSEPGPNVLDFFAASRSSDVMTRQLLFRHNDYLVVCDQMSSGLCSEWRQLLLAKEIELTRRQIIARGWLGVDMTVTLFRFDRMNAKLRPVDPEEVVIDDQPLRQKRLTLKQGPGVGVVGLLDFHRTDEEPWRVKARGRSLVLTSSGRKAVETVELLGGESPSAGWKRKEGRQLTEWEHTRINDPWRPASPAILSDGEIFVRAMPGAAEEIPVSGKDLFCPAGKASSAQQAQELLATCGASIGKLRRESLWSMLVLGPKHVSIMETDGSDGLRYRELSDAGTLVALTGRAKQASSTRLPKQVALIRSDPRDSTAEMFARRSITQYAGFAAETVGLEEVALGRLDGYGAAVLWQADKPTRLAEPALFAIHSFVKKGGTLLCDLPTIEVGQGADASALIGFRPENLEARESVAIVHPELGHVQLSSPELSERRPSSNLGVWNLKLVKGTELIKDTIGRPAITIRPLGRGRVITFCFHAVSIGPDPTDQFYLAKLLEWVLQESDLQPLADAPWVEKTIIPQDDDGLLVGVWNPLPVSVHSPLRLPHHQAPTIQAVYRPTGGDVDAKRIVLPPRKWLVFGVE